MRAILLSLALALPHLAWGGTVVRRALLVGANDGGGELAPLQHAEGDADRVAEVFRTLGGFAPTDITVLSSPTRAELELTLEQLAADRARGDEVLFLFYYSGHADAEGLRLADQVYPWGELKAGVRSIPAEVHLGILDACQSGTITRAKGVKGVTLADPFLKPDGLEVEGEAWIAASAADEEAQESDALGGSFFTHYLLSGLRGAADTGDGKVSLAEAYGYAYERTVARTVGTQAGTQHPAYQWNLEGNGDLALTDVRLASASLILTAGEEGVITVLRQGDQTAVAEIAKRPGVPVQIALEPGTYIVRKRHQGTLGEIRLGLTPGASPVIRQWGFQQHELTLTKGAPAQLAPPPGSLEDEPAPWSMTELELEVVDRDHDGQPEVFNYFHGTPPHRVLARKEADINRDGMMDNITLFSVQGEMVREILDRNFDGNMDQIVYYRHGVRVSSQVDSKGIGASDVYSYYENGKIVLKERDTDGDGQIDRWERYDGGEVIRMGTDTDGDGRIDRLE
ncbi:MAG: caspase family protein [Deltaproteobacteria bacterium]|nr:caspase family protein [Deltaproteobacteria bacterium]